MIHEKIHEFILEKVDELSPGFFNMIQYKVWMYDGWNASDVLKNEFDNDLNR